MHRTLPMLAVLTLAAVAPAQDSGPYLTPEQVPGGVAILPPPPAPF